MSSLQEDFRQELLVLWRMIQVLTSYLIPTTHTSQPFTMLIIMWDRLTWLSVGYFFLLLGTLECEVKCALESITTNKASGGDGIPVELFQILKDDAVKSCTQYASKCGKLSSGHRTGKGQFSFQSQRRAMPKNAQTTTQLHSSHMLVK